MKLFPIRGGIHPDYRKEQTSEKAIVALPLPELLYIPLQQHIGAPAEALVQAGDLVRKGQLIARSQGGISAPQHAPTSGRITAVADIPAPHPSGLPQPTIILEPDGREVWTDLPEPIADPLNADPQTIRERVAQSGIVGMGGAAFPSAVKLDLGTRYKLEILLLNGAECEPYLTCDDRVMREHADEVIDGARIMAHTLGVKKIVIAIEQNKPQALAAMSSAASTFSEVEVVGVPVQYPMGSERHLVQAITGRETPAKKLTADIGVVVHNVATARAVHQAVRFGRPLLGRVVTVSGGAVREPNNIEAPIGARVADLVAFCGGFSGAPASLVNGGPMMGQPLPGLEVPVVKGMSGILALTAGEVNEQPVSACIRCGTCVTICPCGLVPVEMAAFIRKDNFEVAARLGVMDCVSCGSCSWVCPSHIPLVHYFNYAKGMINALERERRKNERVKTLAEAHNARMEKLEIAAEAKRAAVAARKANLAAATAEEKTNA
ncbi:electron transport complex subunit RnfC [Sulfurimicrobium lacus]|uniref:Ion-translocating oxidoreductase complex subunit C n=1 Tax=Sulfurimicrobium lacus TaxID=2715678 RepID=A0A6F8VHE2_9PROT|nr:electron transport complex subunit RsxC [Sulfurimicrobium lacus]BCB28770.1 electron transport complex subunit RnfC [Sulfurimicrobium lacus]